MRNAKGRAKTAKIRKLSCSMTSDGLKWRNARLGVTIFTRLIVVESNIMYH